MDRIAHPLRQMGATVLGRAGGRLPPLTIQGGGLRAIAYATPVASAQIKSAVLLAGLFADGTTLVREPTPSRDHTERMLLAMGGPLRRISPTEVAITPGLLAPLDIHIPGDMSSAAFLLAAAAGVPDSTIRVNGVGVNPTRSGVLDVLETMGAKIRPENAYEERGEPVADIIIESRPLHGTLIAGGLIPRLIDELPVLAVMATQAAGVTEVHDAAELRVKETDRIAVTVAELQRLGATVTALPDGFRVHGPTPLHGAAVDSHGDHRLAMALAVAGLCAEGMTTIHGFACVGDSFPNFADVLTQLGTDLRAPAEAGD